MNLTERAAEHTMVFTVTRHGPQTEMALWIRRGDEVRIGIADDVGILVDVDVIAGGRYRGRVERFLESGDDCVGGVAVGDLIVFTHAHMLACHTPQRNRRPSKTKPAERRASLMFLESAGQGPPYSTRRTAVPSAPYRGVRIRQTTSPPNGGLVVSASRWRVETLRPYGQALPDEAFIDAT